MTAPDDLHHRLTEDWNLSDPHIEVHNGGMNSATWFVSSAGRRYVAKTVPRSAAPDMAAGLAVATALERAGVPAGAPVPTRSGALLSGSTALLAYVPGHPPDHATIGATLARVHRILREVSVPGEQTFHWLNPDEPHLTIRPWIRPAVTAAITAYDRLGPLTRGLLHTDPAPEAFRSDGRTCGLIDWSVAMRGPLLYDLASAVMYAGDDLIPPYLAGGALSPAEVTHALPTMIRFRWAVQADYFARRILTGDLTGIDSPAENEKGLADAERHLT